MRRSLRSGLALGLAVVVVLVALPLVGGLGGLLGALNPFDSERHERIDPAVLTALHDADELRAATAELQVVIEVEDDTRFLPDVLSGQQTTFLAAGAVDAVVDLGEADVRRAADGAVVVTLPVPVIDRVALDNERSRVLDRDRGLFDRVGDVFSDNPDDDADLYALAEGELRRAAGETGLLAQAEDSATATVEQLLAGAGIDDVSVVFVEPATTTSP